MKRSKQNKINSIIISSLETILSAFKKMDQTNKRLLLVFDEDKFVNVLSVGDLQRAIISKKPLNTPIGLILRSFTRVATIQDSFFKIKQQMMENRVEFMPVLNEQNKLVDVHFWEDIFAPEEKRIKAKLNLPIVIMAGGKGSRLRPLTNVIPKPLIPIGDKTIIEEIMNRFIEVGCTDFYLSVNYKAETIKHYFDQLKNNKYKINYFQEDKPLGTAGSLFLIKEKIHKTFFVSNCDIIIDADYSDILEFHTENKNELTIVSALKHYPIPYGIVKTGDNGLLLELQEKPDITFQINSGMYILESHLLNEIPENEFFHITNLVESIIRRNGRVGVFPVSEGSWKDIGDWDKYINTLKL